MSDWSDSQMALLTECRVGTVTWRMDGSRMVVEAARSGTVDVTDDAGPLIAAQMIRPSSQPESPRPVTLTDKGAAVLDAQ